MTAYRRNPWGRIVPMAHYGCGGPDCAACEREQEQAEAKVPWCCGGDRPLCAVHAPLGNL